MFPVVAVAAIILYNLPPDILSTLLCEQSVELCTGLYRVLGENTENCLRLACFGLVLKAAGESKPGTTKPARNDHS